MSTSLSTSRRILLLALAGLVVAALGGWATLVAGPLLAAIAIVLCGFALLSALDGLRWVQQRDILAPVWLFTATYWGFYGLSLINVPNSWGLYMPPDMLQVYALGYLMFMAGALVAWWVWRLPAGWPSRHAGGEVHDPGRLLLVGAAAAGVGLAATLWTTRFGGLGGIGGDLARMAAKVSVPAYLPYLSALLEAAGVILAVELFNHGAGDPYGLAKGLLLALAGGCLIALSGARSVLVPIATAFGLSLHYFRRRLGLREILPGAAAAVLALALWYSARRLLDYSSWDSYVSLVAIPKGVSAEWAWLASPYLQARDAGSLLVRILRLFPASFLFWRGGVFLSHVLTFLPGKQWLVDDWITVYIRGLDPGLVGGTPPTILGGFYMDAGMPGVVAGMFVTGLVAQAGYAAFRRRPTPLRLSCYAYIISFICVSVYGFVHLSVLLLFKLAAVIAAWRLVQWRVAPDASRIQPEESAIPEDRR